MDYSVRGVEDDLIAQEDLRYTREEIDAFLALLTSLTPRELMVLRYSMLGVTQQEIGLHIRRHQSQVSRIYHSACMKLTHGRSIDEGRCS